MAHRAKGSYGVYFIFQSMGNVHHRQHTGGVLAVTVTSDGLRAVSASYEHTLRLWDLSNCQALCTLEGHTNGANVVAVTPAGRRAVSASWDYTLRLLALENGKEIATFTGESEND